MSDTDITDARLETIARTEIRDTLDDWLDSSIEFTALENVFGLSDDDEWARLVKRYETIIRRIVDREFPATTEETAR